MANSKLDKIFVLLSSQKSESGAHRHNPYYSLSMIVRVVSRKAGDVATKTGVQSIVSSRSRQPLSILLSAMIEPVHITLWYGTISPE
eukprot:scaffold10861_cov180-Amphora_coffeaeformis.AAC.35